MIEALELIAKIKNAKTRNAVLKDFSANMKIYEALREIARNVIKRNVPLNSSQKKKLRRYKKVIISLSNSKNSKRKKRKLVEQSGGFLPILIPIITGILGEVIGNGLRS